MVVVGDSDSHVGGEIKGHRNTKESLDPLIKAMLIDSELSIQKAYGEAMEYTIYLSE